MIEELKWDTEFFGRKMGILTPPFSGAGLAKAVGNAEKRGYKYLLCKLKGGDFAGVGVLGQNGFYLSDIGVIWEINVSAHAGKKAAGIKTATEKDARKLKGMVKGLFTHSRFYNDPFFGKSEADGLFGAWVENSLKGKAADVVFHAEAGGFITCRKVTASKGEIPLVGVIKAGRGKGLGRALMGSALKWFKEQGVRRVAARTQLRNIEAMNYYGALGFRIKDSYIVMSKALG